MKSDDQETSKAFICLLDELETSRKLIESGFGRLQEIDMSNDFYHLPHQLLASGLERLMKGYLALAYEDQNGTLPDHKWFKRRGHDLLDLLDLIANDYYGGLRRPLVASDLAFIKTDQVLRRSVGILSEFGKFGRYYNFDVVGGKEESALDPKYEWGKLESSLGLLPEHLHDPEALQLHYYPRVHACLIAKLERLVRAIALQFTIGDHPDRFGRLRQASVGYSSFRNLRDRELGTIDYRQSAKLWQQKIAAEWKQRNANQIRQDGWPARWVTRAESDFDWPFRVERVIVECREDLFCLVNINQYDFALNGAARSRFNLPTPHDAGLAVLGKSIGPLMDVAFSLRTPLENC